MVSAHLDNLLRVCYPATEMWREQKVLKTEMKTLLPPIPNDAASKLYTFADYKPVRFNRILR